MKIFYYRWTKNFVKWCVRSNTTRLTHRIDKNPPNLFRYTVYSMPSTAASIICKFTWPKKSKITSVLGIVLKYTTKNPKHQIILLSEARLARVSTDLSSSSDDSVVQMDPTDKITKKRSARNNNDGHTREYLYTKWLQSKDLLDSEVRKNSKLLRNLNVRDSLIKSFERKSII